MQRRNMFEVELKLECTPHESDVTFECHEVTKAWYYHTVKDALDRFETLKEFHYYRNRYDKCEINLWFWDSASRPVQLDIFLTCNGKVIFGDES